MAQVGIPFTHVATTDSGEGLKGFAGKRLTYQTNSLESPDD
jgi:hypothetical protein